MLELFGIFNYIENYSNNTDLKSNLIPNPLPISWLLIALIIGFSAACIAYNCNKKETPASRALATIIAFFFSGLYLLYYFIYHVLFGKKCF